MEENQISRTLSNFQFTIKNIKNNIFRLKKREDGQIIYLLNEGEIPRKFNLTTETIYGKTVVEIFGEEQSQTVKGYFERAFAGEIVQYRVEFGDVWFETILSPIEENGEIVEVAGSSYDITDKVRYQQEIERLNEEMKALLLTDKLTKLSNRRRIDSVLDYEILQSTRYARNLSIIFIDIDHFKAINDTHGHIAGDRLLKKVSHIIRDNTRDTDTPGRWGGDEFIIICPETPVEEATTIAERIRERLANYTFEGGFNVTASFGVCQHTTGLSKEAFLHKGDQLMYKAKRTGKNKVC